LELFHVGGKDICIKKIYVRLLNEGVDVYRPVKAIEIDSNTYKIEGDHVSAYKNDLEEWEFRKNDVVRCEYKYLQEGAKDKLFLVAVQLLGL